MPGTFIDVHIDAAAGADPELAKQLEGVCPVDIFTAEDGQLALVEGSLDECVLCLLCMDAVPGKVKVLKLYDGGAEL